MESSTLAFVIGTGRCGSTFLAEVLSEHASVGFVSNYDDRFRLPLGIQGSAAALYQRAPRVDRWVPGRISDLVRYSWVRPSEGYRALAREVSPWVVAPVRDLVASDATPWMRRRLRGFFERRIKAQGRPVFVHKFTGWPRARLLHEVFPQARFIHVVRDGRAVANSLLQQPWWTGFAGPDAWGWGALPDQYRLQWLRADRSFAVLAGIEWMMLMDAFREASHEIPNSHWLELRYEDLLADPQGSIRLVLEFLGLSWDDQIADRVASYEFRVGRAEAFRQDLAPRDVALLDEIMRSHLAEHGYVST